MHPSVHSKVPGKCPICGMDLVVVIDKPGETNGLANQNLKAGELTIPLERLARIGVKYAQVRLRQMRVAFRAVGTFSLDQSRITSCVARLDGYVDAVNVVSPGEHVTAGQLAMTISCPDLRAPEQELVNLLKVVKTEANGAPASMQQLIDLARRRLELLGVAPQEISELERTGNPTDQLAVRAPCDGVVNDTAITTGMQVKRGDTLVTLVDLSSLWLWVQFYENEFELLTDGQVVQVLLPAIPGLTLTGHIKAISPVVEPATRTAKVRVDIANSDGRLKPGMYAEVVADIDAGQKLTIPSEAVLPTGSRMLVFVERGFGKLEPRFVNVGRQFVDSDGRTSESYYEVISGLVDGDRVVSSANFLIDSEAKIQGVIKDFQGE
jgi:membrane fusion protein, copper/silver efflux system